MLSLVLLAAVANAQESGPPSRTVPNAVLIQLAAIEDRFELALATDCDNRLCFSKGCAYGAHTVADRPPAASLPGLGQEPGPTPAEAQAWLTQARCEFAYEAALEAADVQALARRLQTKVSTGFATVSVGTQALPPLSPTVTDPEPQEDVPEAVEPPPPPPPEPWTLATPFRELWASLLDDFDWMIGLVLGTFAATLLIWAWRRVGRETIEERALLAELAREVAPTDTPAGDPADEVVTAQRASWRLRLQEHPPDPALQAMLRELLRSGELPLLAKAVLTFPETLPQAFPTGGDIGPAKLALAAYLKTVEPSALPSDAELFLALDRHGSSATLVSQRDADVVRSLREDFGADGLVRLIHSVPPRAGALLFALAPGEAQHELVHLLTSARMAALSEQLLRSNRMDPSETEHLSAVIRADAAAVAAPDDVSDRGATFDAAGALSILLAQVDPAERAALFATALRRFGGSLPAWYAEILLPEMLLALPSEDRADLLLGIEADALAAWLSLQDPPLAERVLEGAPAALRSSVRAAAPARARAVALADGGRRALASSFQAQLARQRLPFEDVVRGLAEGRA